MCQDSAPVSVGLQPYKPVHRSTPASDFEQHDWHLDEGRGDGKYRSTADSPNTYFQILGVNGSIKHGLKQPRRTRRHGHSQVLR
jgi:hypothetical protein